MDHFNFLIGVGVGVKFGNIDKLTLKLHLTSWRLISFLDSSTITCSFLCIWLRFWTWKQTSPQRVKEVVKSMQGKPSKSDGVFGGRCTLVDTQVKNSSMKKQCSISLYLLVMVEAILPSFCATFFVWPLIDFGESRWMQQCCTLDCNQLHYGFASGTGP